MNRWDPTEETIWGVEVKMHHVTDFVFSVQFADKTIGEILTKDVKFNRFLSLVDVSISRPFYCGRFIILQLQFACNTDEKDHGKEVPLSANANILG